MIFSEKDKQLLKISDQFDISQIKSPSHGEAFILELKMIANTHYTPINHYLILKIKKRIDELKYAPETCLPTQGIATR